MSVYILTAKKIFFNIQSQRTELKNRESGLNLDWILENDHISNLTHRNRFLRNYGKRQGIIQYLSPSAVFRSR